MKNLFLACMIAATAAFSFGAPAQAATVVYHTPHYGHRHVGPRCYMKRVKHYRHGRVWYRNVRVCR